MKPYEKLANDLFEDYKLNGIVSATRLFREQQNTLKLTVGDCAAITDTFQKLVKKANQNENT